MLLIGMDIIVTGDFVITNKDGVTWWSFCWPSTRRTDYVAEHQVKAALGSPTHGGGLHRPKKHKNLARPRSINSRFTSSPPAASRSASPRALAGAQLRADSPRGVVSMRSRMRRLGKRGANFQRSAPHRSPKTREQYERVTQDLLPRTPGRVAAAVARGRVVIRIWRQGPRDTGGDLAHRSRFGRLAAFRWSLIFRWAAVYARQRRREARVSVVDRVRAACRASCFGGWRGV